MFKTWSNAVIIILFTFFRIFHCTTNNIDFQRKLSSKGKTIWSWLFIDDLWSKKVMNDKVWYWNDQKCWKVSFYESVSFTVIPIVRWNWLAWLRREDCICRVILFELLILYVDFDVSHVILFFVRWREAVELVRNRIVHFIRRYIHMNRCIVYCPYAQVMWIAEFSVSFIVERTYQQQQAEISSGEWVERRWTKLFSRTFVC